MPDMEYFLSGLHDCIEKGNYLQVINVAQKELDRTEDDSIRKPLALALSRTGSVDRAMEVLKPLLGTEETDHETLALAGGILKRQWEATGDRRYLEDSYSFYLRSFREGESYWAGINAATLASVMDLDVAKVLADEVLEICWEEYGRMGTRSPFWLLVSIAEGHLVKGDVKTAVKWYKLVTPMSYKSVGQIKTVRRNAGILGRKLGGETPELLKEAIHTPKIAFFAGHRIDREGMPARFPQKDTDRVKRNLRAALGKLRISVGVASLADGADILFHECLIEAGRQSRVVLPSPVEDFRAKLAADDPGGWLERFDRVLQRAAVVEVVSRATFDHYDEDAYSLTTDFMIGYSLNLAEELDGEMVPIVVWDRKIHERKGGTYCAVKKLRSFGLEPETIPLFPETEKNDVSPGFSGDSYDGNAPFRCSMVVVGPGGDFSSDQTKAIHLGAILEQIRKVLLAGKYPVLKKSLGYEEVYLVFQELTDAHSFIADLLGTGCSCSVTAHTDFALLFDERSFSARQLYSPALSEMVSLGRNLFPGDVFCTTSYRSLVRYFKLDSFGFQYAGSYSAEGEEDINLFRMLLEE